MKRFIVLAAILAVLPLTSHSQQTAQGMKNGGEAKRPGETEEQKGKRLLDEMVKALGGDAWMNKKTMYREGQTTAFFRGAPSSNIVRYVEYRKFADGKTPELSRVEFKTWRGMIMPGMKKDLVHLWTADQGYEVTYKGQTILPEKQVADHMRLRAHSIEEVMHNWVRQPGVIIVSAGQGMRDRHPVDKVTIMAANNDSVTIEIDQETHLPLQRSFQWRNAQFKDYDIDEEVYGDWRIFDGVETPMNMTNYRDGDIFAEDFYTMTRFNQPQPEDLYDPTKLLKK